jgi:putative Holliday junction resolvase
VAISDETGVLATPLAVITRRSKVEDFARISHLVRENRAAKLVVGHPLDDDGSVGPQARRIERYTAALSGALRATGIDLPIVFWDERMSTVRAEGILRSAGRRPKERRGWIDAVAAAVILQDYLDAHRPLSEGGEQEVSL